MQTDQQKQAIAVRVLGIGKRRAPDRFPRYDAGGQLDVELINEWATALGRKVYPLELWEEAVEHWINHLDHGRMVTTGEMLRAAKQVRQKWENDPTRRAQFQQLYEARQQERDRQLAAGEFGRARGYVPREIERKRVDASVLDKALKVVSRDKSL